jgi:hypothetical protein
LKDDCILIYAGQLKVPRVSILTILKGKSNTNPHQFNAQDSNLLFMPLEFKFPF